MRLTSHALSHPGVVRVRNEDAFLSMPGLGLWAVADGMGGHAAGEVASRLAIDTLQRQFEDHGPQDIDLALLRLAIANANSAIWHYSLAHLAGAAMGTTLVLLWLDGEVATWLWAGDSRGYLLRRRQLLQQTRDHNRAQQLVTQGLLSAAQAERHPQAQVITRALGVAPQVMVEEVSLKVCTDDLFLLCSDGLNRELSHGEILGALACGDVVECARALLHGALVKGARDNVTLVVVKLAGPAAATPQDAATIPLLR